ncbi:hypothetical protein [Methylotetracoccus oryzae]|uniref:hypothetical protein n=1 Tax=Methylotetracoccus oryzae TaxID=1919059 RepID=UPI001118860F|nr:hypothetical protein [Methylotetracoccus oryzae]
MTALHQRNEVAQQENRATPRLCCASMVCALTLVAATGHCAADEPVATANAGETSPWSFNLTAYAWLPGVTGNYSAGPLSKSVDVNFIDIAGKLSSVPLAFMGRFEAHYERFGFYLDGNYMDLDFKDKSGPRGLASVGLSTQLGLMDYGVMYRLFGPSPADHSNWQGMAHSNRLDVYLAGRTLWLTNTLDPKRLGERTSSATVTAPLIGGRFAIDLSPDWFVMADGNLGGFGAENVSFTGTLQGLVGYRFQVGDVPSSVELGYRALRISTEPNPRMETNTTLSGPFAGFTAHW